MTRAHNLMLRAAALALFFAPMAFAQTGGTPKPVSPTTSAKPSKRNADVSPAGNQSPAQKPAAKPAAKPGPMTSAGAKDKKEKKETKSEMKPAAEKEPPPQRRDPFQPLIAQHQGPVVPANLPPGKAGLIISTLRVDGMVRSPNGMLVVVSNPQQRTYFLREGDRVYDGRVERITLDGVTFLENAKDAFGRPVERLVTKRLYATAGEQP